MLLPGKTPLQCPACLSIHIRIQCKYWGGGWGDISGADCCWEVGWYLEGAKAGSWGKRTRWEIIKARAEVRERRRDSSKQPHWISKERAGTYEHHISHWWSLSQLGLTSASLRVSWPILGQLSNGISWDIIIILIDWEWDVSHNCLWKTNALSNQSLKDVFTERSWMPS